MVSTIRHQWQWLSSGPEGSFIRPCIAAKHSDECFVDGSHVSEALPRSSLELAQRLWANGWPRGVMGPMKAHMVVDTRAWKWADLLRRCNRRRTPQQRKIATKSYADISSAVIEYERRYGCIELRNTWEGVVNVLCLVHKNPCETQLCPLSEVISEGSPYCWTQNLLASSSAGVFISSGSGLPHLLIQCALSPQYWIGPPSPPATWMITRS
jgi:hypothetical protein